MAKKIMRNYKKRVKYDKWGYIFITPFFVTFTIFSLVPLFLTIYYSFFEYYKVGLGYVGPRFIGLQNYIYLFKTDLPRYAFNTIFIWIVGFIPQIVVAMLLALVFTSYRLKIKGQRFFKTVMYMPNLIMASAFSMLFFALFSDNGPVNIILVNAGILEEPFRFLSDTSAVRSLIATMNYLMWFGNTAILLMAGIMGIDQSLFEQASIDGAKSYQIFFKVTLPLLRPILVYVLITSMIGGIQMFDVPEILTNGDGSPDRTSMTIIMYLNKYLEARNFGKGGALSVIILIFTLLLSLVVYRSWTSKYRPEVDKTKKIRRRERA